jgi:hypothetical protein
MNEEERKTVLDFYLHNISEDELLRRFRIGRSDGTSLALRVLEEAYRAKDAVSAECGLGLVSHFGTPPQSFDILVKLSDAEWHERHEDVVTALGELHDSRSVETLYRAALKRHPYLSFDNARALAVKAIWALGQLGDATADQKLRLLADSDETVIRVNAQKQLYRRSGRITPEDRERGSALSMRIDGEKDQTIRTQLLQQLKELDEQQQAAEQRWIADQGWRLQ